MAKKFKFNFDSAMDGQTARDLVKALNMDELDFINEALSVPIIRRKFEKHLVDCEITEGITKVTIEVEFMRWFIDTVLCNCEMEISFNLDHLRW